MKERPILFCGEMVRAILEGRKTQTRRVVKFRKPFDHPSAWPYVNKFDDGWWVWTDFDPTPKDMAILRQNGNGRPCPYGEPGDRLWVKETWQGAVVKNEVKGIGYRASYEDDRMWFRVLHGLTDAEYAKWCKIWDKYQDKWRPSIFMPRWASRITLEITAVRVQRLQDITPDDCRAEGQPSDNNDVGVRYGFGQLWNRINGNWDDNPWVWAIEFKVI